MLGFRLSYYGKGQIRVTENQGVWHLWEAGARAVDSLQLLLGIHGFHRRAVLSLCLFLSSCCGAVMINLGANVTCRCADVPMRRMRGGFVARVDFFLSGQNRNGTTERL